jgi:hypothetical protein
VSQNHPPSHHIRLAALRPLWKYMFLDSYEDCNIYFPSFNNPELSSWTTGVPQLAQVHNMSSPSTASIVMPLSPTSPTTEADTLHWWLGNTSEEMIRWYLGHHSSSPVQNHSIRIYDKLNTLLHRAHANFNRAHGITNDVLWDHQHLREYHKDSDKTPYISFSSSQKSSHRRILYDNRRLRLSHQTPTPIRSSILPVVSFT